MGNFLDSYFGLIRRALPAKKESTSVGLDIGMNECKLVELKKSGDEFQLINWAIESVNDGDLSATLRKLFESLKQPCKYPYTSVSGKGTLIRYIDMPRMGLSDLKNSFAIEADKYFPFAQDQIYTDCFILDPEGKDKRMSVLAAAAKKELIDERIKLLTELDVSADFIGVNAIALSNVFHVLGAGRGEEDNGVIAILDMGEAVSSLTIVVDRVPRFTRDIFIGGRDLTKSISNALGISFEQAEQLKRQPGDRLQEVANASETAITNIIQELRLSFDYFTTEKNNEIKELLLSGGGSMLQGIYEIFGKNLEIKVNKWDPLSSLKISEDLKVEELQLKSLKLGVALGLALYEYD